MIRKNNFKCAGSLVKIQAKKDKNKLKNDKNKNKKIKVNKNYNLRKYLIQIRKILYKNKKKN